MRLYPPPLQTTAVWGLKVHRLDALDLAPSPCPSPALQQLLLAILAFTVLIRKIDLMVPTSPTSEIQVDKRLSLAAWGTQGSCSH